MPKGVVWTLRLLLAHMPKGGRMDTSSPSGAHAEGGRMDTSSPSGAHAEGEQEIEDQIPAEFD
eukprot:6448269-Amphidinium_carterae.1